MKSSSTLTIATTVSTKLTWTSFAQPYTQLFVLVPELKWPPSLHKRRKASLGNGLPVRFTCLELHAIVIHNINIVVLLTFVLISSSIK